MPSLNTRSTFARSLMSWSGLPSTRIRSACFPSAIDPTRASIFWNFAPLRVAMPMASSGVKPASTRSRSAAKAEPLERPELRLGVEEREVVLGWKPVHDAGGEYGEGRRDRDVVFHEGRDEAIHFRRAVRKREQRLGRTVPGRVEVGLLL